MEQRIDRLLVQNLSDGQFKTYSNLLASANKTASTQPDVEAALLAALERHGLPPELRERILADVRSQVNRSEA